jgi:hypothetical protein
MANRSSYGLKTSLGLMANYMYDFDVLPDRAAAFASSGSFHISEDVSFRLHASVEQLAAEPMVPSS